MTIFEVFHWKVKQLSCLAENLKRGTLELVNIKEETMFLLYSIFLRKLIIICIV